MVPRLAETAAVVVLTRFVVLAKGRGVRHRDAVTQGKAEVGVSFGLLVSDQTSLARNGSD